MISIVVSCKSRRINYLYGMKHYYALLLLLICCYVSRAQGTLNKDTPTIKNTNGVFASIEEIPEFPGGTGALATFLAKNLRYPSVAFLIGLEGRVSVSFVVEKDGKLTNVRSTNCIGAGCDAEAVRVIAKSPNWKPGTKNGVPVRVDYSIPISFSLGKEDKMTYTDNLRNSPYGFVFNIKGVLYTIDEAEKILGKQFSSDQIELAEPFYNYNKVEKFDMPDKKEVYLLIFKKS